jgi:hypothetical protein
MTDCRPGAKGSSHTLVAPTKPKPAAKKAPAKKKAAAKKAGD